MAKPTTERVKATRVRRKAVDGHPLSDEEAAFIGDYENSKPPSKGGKSASSRVVHLDIEEQAAAEGDHPHPEAYAAVMRAEGLRADTLMSIVTTKLIQCNEQYMNLMVHMMERSTRLEDAHVALLEAVRESHLARIEAEGEAMMERRIAQAAGGDDELGELLKFLLVAKAQAEQPGGKKVKAKKKPPLGAVER